MVRWSTLGLVRLSRPNTCQSMIPSFIVDSADDRVMAMRQTHSTQDTVCRWAVTPQWTGRPCSSRTSLSVSQYAYCITETNRTDVSLTNTSTLRLYHTWQTPQSSRIRCTLSSFQMIFAGPSPRGTLRHSLRQTILRDYRAKSGCTIPSLLWEQNQRVEVGCMVIQRRYIGRLRRSTGVSTFCGGLKVSEQGGLLGA